MVETLSEIGRLSGSDTAFVQELGRQAIVSPDSMMAREIGYAGFVAAPVLSEALFNNPRVQSHYHPLRGLGYDDFSGADAQMAERFFHALDATLKNVLKTHDYWGDRSLVETAEHLRWLADDVHRQIRADRGKYDLVIALHFGLKGVIKQVREHLASLDQRRYDLLYLSNTDGRHTVIDEIAEATINVLNSFANDFDGSEGPFWSMAIGVFGEVFEHFGDLPDGMDPLQQHVAIKMMDKVKHNMDGFYPALTRVLLLTIGPYRDAVRVNPKSAFGLLREAFYAEMKRLPELHRTHPEKVGHYIPPGARYDAEKGVLIRVFADGQERATDLSKLKLEPISFTTDVIRNCTQVNDVTEAAA